MRRLFTLMFAMLCLIGTSALAQGSLSFTLNQQPCNNNGIVTTTVTGLSNPFTITYYIGNQPPIVHTVTSGNTDVLNNYSGASMYVYAVDNMQNAASSQYSALPFTISVNQWNTVVCPAMATIPVTVSGGVSPYTYNWTDNATNVTVSTSNPATLPGGNYDLVVTDNNGCTVTLDSGVNVYSQASFQVSTTTTQANCTNGSATASVSGTGTAPYSYLWSNNATTSSINSLTMGGYSVTVTDAQGCSANGYAYVSQAVNINTNIVSTPATCVQNNGAVSSFPSGGVPPYTYLWNNLATSQTLTNLSAGYYSLTVTDANGCIGTGSKSVTASTPVNVTYTATASSCTSPTGSATLSISGGATPYSVLWNTFPAQTATTATALAPGSYSFTVTDANGCIRIGTAVVPPVNVVTASITSTSPTCVQANGSISVTPSGGTAPYSYLWNNSATTQSISSLSAGYYSVTITDNAGCSKVISKNLPAYSPVSLGLATTPASCIYTSDGVITATAVGGTAPYTWNTTSGTNVINNLATGNYYVSVTDANGCSASSYTNVPYNPNGNACYCTITGTVYEDANSNCIMDAGEQGIPNIQMHLSGFGYAYTNANGVYSFKAPSGSYTLSESIQTIYPLASCQNNSISVTATAAANCTQTYDFANAINPIHDVKVTTWNVTCPVPGYNYQAVTIISNEGTVAESNIVAGYEDDAQLSAPTISPSAVWVNNGASKYNINSSANFSLNPGSSQAFYIDHLMPTNIPLNTQLTMKDTVAYTAPMSNWTNDYTAFNNVKYFNATVVGSYDPNYKEVSPAGEGPTGKIYEKDSVLDYIVHFQNLGTYQAFNIYVLDTLDADLDWTTLKPGHSSHPSIVSMSETGVLKYTFNNINLPAKMHDEIGSNGYFTYSIKTKKNMPIGTQFTNSAAIYFDFNEPVITNTTVNTLSEPTSTSDINAFKNGYTFMLYPNPANDICYVKFNVDNSQEKVSIKLADITGKNIVSTNVSLAKGEQVIPITTSALTAGVYFVTVGVNDASSTQKLIITK